MNQFRWKSSVFAGFFILIFPLTGTSAVYGTAEKLEGEGFNSPKEVPVRDNKAPRELLHFLNSSAAGLKPPEVDKILWQLLSIQNKYLKFYEKQLCSDTINLKINRYSLPELMNIREIQEENIKNLVRNILADGLILAFAEGMVYAEIDFSGISAHFGRYASQPVAGYLRIMARETAGHFAEDAALKISPDTLGRRIVAIETFRKENRRFPRQNELAQLARKYFTTYMLGLNNTPAFRYQTNRLDGRFLRSYYDSVVIYPGTRFAACVKDYLKVLSENGFQKTKPVLEFAVKTAANF